MSSYLHVLPIIDDEYESLVSEQGLSLDGIERGKLPTQRDFDNAVSEVEPYEYRFNDEYGVMHLRMSTPEELYKIISSVACSCGAQLVTTDDMELFIFRPETTLVEFRDSALFAYE